MKLHADVYDKLYLWVLFLCAFLEELIVVDDLCVYMCWHLIILTIDYFFRYITPEKFYVEPIGTKVLLVVDRVSQQIYTQGN